MQNIYEIMFFQRVNSSLWALGSKNCRTIHRIPIDNRENIDIYPYFHDYVYKIVKKYRIEVYFILNLRHMAKTLSVLNKIYSLRERYYRAAVGKDALIALLSETEIAEQVYNSNAIENSTLSLEETEKILLQIDLDRYITEREIFEAKNLARVVSYIDTRAKEQELGLDIVLLLHKMLISNIRDDIA